MAASAQFSNIILDSGIHIVTGVYGPISIHLYKDDSEISAGDYASQIITGWGTASNGVKQISNTISFNSYPLSTGYDEIRLYSQTGTFLLISQELGSTRTLNALDTHQLTVSISGN